MALISIREYARQRGCSDTAVHKAIRTGKIVKGVERDAEDRPRINPEVADLEWSVHFDHGAAKNQKLASKIPKAKTDTAGPVEIPDGGGTTGSLAKARLAQTISKAKLLDMEFKQKSGKLVEKDKVYNALFAAGQEVRSAMQAIPDRHIDEILSASSRNEAHIILYNVISEALEVLADFSKRELVPRTA